MKFLAAFALLSVGFASAQNVGINTITPTQALDVVGAVKFSGALLPNNTAGTTGQVLTSAGAGNVPTWTAPAAPALIVSVLQTGNYVASVTDVLIQANIPSAGFTVTLPTVGVPVGKLFYITNKGVADWLIVPTPATNGQLSVFAGTGHTLIWTGSEYVGVGAF